MVSYRIYQLRSSNNDMETFQDFHADTDSTAIAFAQTLRNLNAMELWCGHRKVRRWEATASSEEQPGPNGIWM
jgi:hypothetical protein